MSPTFISDIYIDITATIIAKKKFAPTFYTDIYTDKTAATFSVHRPAANLITFPKLSQKKEEEGDHRKKQVYTLLYKDSTSTVLNIQSKC